MNLNQIEKLIHDNEIEIEKIKNKQDIYENYTKRARNDCIEFLEKENEKLKQFLRIYQDNSKKIIQLEESKKADSSNRKEINKQIKECKFKIISTSGDFAASKQGKVRNIVGCLIGQLDRKIHNFIYSDWALGKKLFEYHSDFVNFRYKWHGLMVYTLARIAIATAAALIFSGVGVINTAFIAITAIRFVSTIYNKFRYGGPLIEREKKIYKGRYFENLDNAVFELTRTKEINATVKKTRRNHKTVTQYNDNSKENISTIDVSVRENVVANNINQKLKKISDKSVLESLNLRELKSIIQEVRRNGEDKLNKEELIMYKAVIYRFNVLNNEEKQKRVREINADLIVLSTSNPTLDGLNLDQLKSIIRRVKNVGENNLTKDVQEVYKLIVYRFNELNDKKNMDTVGIDDGKRVGNIMYKIKNNLPVEKHELLYLEKVLKNASDLEEKKHK